MRSKAKIVSEQKLGVVLRRIYKRTNKGRQKAYPCLLAGIAGLEPAKCRSQSPVPYRLGDIPKLLTFSIITYFLLNVNGFYAINYFYSLK